MSRSPVPHLVSQRPQEERRPSRERATHSRSASSYGRSRYLDRRRYATSSMASRFRIG